MSIRKDYKFRLKIRGIEDRKLKDFTECCHFVWNKSLAIQEKFFRNEANKILFKTELLNSLPAWKKEQYLFLRDAHPQILQQRLVVLVRPLSTTLPQAEEKPDRRTLRGGQFELSSIQKEICTRLFSVSTGIQDYKETCPSSQNRLAQVLQVLGDKRHA